MGRDRDASRATNKFFFFKTKEQRKGDEMSMAVHTDESTNVHLQQEEQEEKKRKEKKKQTNKQKENAGTLAKDVKKKKRERFNRKAMMMN